MTRILTKKVINSSGRAIMSHDKQPWVHSSIIGLELCYSFTPTQLNFVCILKLLLSHTPSFLVTTATVAIEYSVGSHRLKMSSCSLRYVESSERREKYKSDFPLYFTKGITFME